MNGPIRQHKMLAMGEGLMSGDFGVDPLTSHAAGGPTPAGSKYLPDHQRGKPVAGRGLPNQSNPDHGPHR